MHRITYSRKTVAIKVLIALLFIVVISLVFFSDFIVNESSLSKIFIYITISIILLFFLTAFLICTYFLFKPRKVNLLTFDEASFYYKNEKIPFETVSMFAYGLNRKKFWTMLFEGFIIETATRDIVIPTFQLMSNKEVAKWVFEPLELYAPELFEEVEEEEEG